MIIRGDTTRRTAQIVAVAALTSLLACSAPTSPAEGRVAIGAWGGDHLRVDVTSGGGTTEYDCAHGSIDEPLVADQDGRFSASGTHTFDHGGPIRIDEAPDRHPARYDGRVVGDIIQLSVTVTDTQQMVGSFTLTRAGAPRLQKCL
jgi:hypothetical protein